MVEDVGNLPDIYCDLDQVLVNFMKGADKAVGGSFVDSPKEDRWNKVNQIKGFWANLDWMPGAKRLYQFIEKHDPFVLSAYTGRDPTSKVGKMKWLKKNTNFKRSHINLVLRSQKQKYAITDGKPNVLIDDYIKNINEWESKGGIGIHHTNVSKTISDLKRLGFK
jgi:5'(3')-deoxyribonucleotidase